jgi:hypothetical protein
MTARIVKQFIAKEKTFKVYIVRTSLTYQICTWDREAGKDLLLTIQMRNMYDREAYKRALKIAQVEFDTLQ